MHVIKEPAMTWIDIAEPVGMIVLQRNGLGDLRMAQRMPVGGATDADIPLCDADAMARLFQALAAVYGVQVAITDGRARAVGFRS